MTFINRSAHSCAATTGVVAPAPAVIVPDIFDTDINEKVPKKKFRNFLVDIRVKDVRDNTVLTLISKSKNFKIFINL